MDGGLLVALQVFYIVLSIIVLGWAVWITKEVLKNTRTLAAILERCQSRGTWIQEISDDIKKTCRNVVRLGVKMGLDEELEHPK